MAKISVFSNAPRKNDIPFAPCARIWLSEYSGDDDKRILLSPILLNDIEIDQSVDSLITQLEQARINAKTLLKNNQLLQSLQKKHNSTVKQEK